MNLLTVDDAIKSFDDYYRLQDKLLNGKFNDLGVEGRKRLLQAKKILQKIVVAHNTESSILDDKLRMPKPVDGQTHQQYFESAEYKAWVAKHDSPEMKAAIKRYSDLGDELELNSECFYWIAGRARTIIKKMPGLFSFEAVGVRNVRNKLIEHSEKGDSGVVFGGFGWGTAKGPVLKAIRLDSQKDIFPDDGLFPNAQEFFSNITAACEKATRNPSTIVASP